MDSPLRDNSARAIRSAGLIGLLATNSEYAVRYEDARAKAGILNSTQLRYEFQPEYNSWRNRKKWALDMSRTWHASMTDFRGFLVVNGPIPSPGWTLDRINSSGEYVPDNLRWASKELQTRNRSNSRTAQVGDTNLPLMEAAKSLGLSYQAVRRIVDRDKNGISVLFFKVRQRKHLRSLNQSPAMESLQQEMFAWEFSEVDFSGYEKAYVETQDIRVTPIVFVKRVLEMRLQALERARSQTDDEIKWALEVAIKEKELEFANNFVRRMTLLLENQVLVDAVKTKKLREETKRINDWRLRVIAEGKVLRESKFGSLAIHVGGP